MLIFFVYTSVYKRTIVSIMLKILQIALSMKKKKNKCTHCDGSFIQAASKTLQN